MAAWPSGKAWVCKTLIPGSNPGAASRKFLFSAMRTWRNWQTRKIQVLVVARLWGFKSLRPHQVVPLAQLDRASDYGSEGREFESFRARQLPHPAVG
jgi:hypothetical protein